MVFTETEYVQEAKRNPASRFINGYKQARDAADYLDAITPLDFQFAFIGKFQRALGYTDGAQELQDRIVDNSGNFIFYDSVFEELGAAAYRFLHPMKTANAMAITKAIVELTPEE